MVEVSKLRGAFLVIVLVLSSMRVVPTFAQDGQAGDSHQAPSQREVKEIELGETRTRPDHGCW